MSKTDGTIPVSYRAIRARINRALERERKVVFSDRRGGRTAYMLLDLKTRKVLETGVDLAALVRRLDLLNEWERLGDLLPPSQVAAPRRAPPRARKSQPAQAEAS